MSGAVSFAEIDGQYVELLPARTTMQVTTDVMALVEEVTGSEPGAFNFDGVGESLNGEAQPNGAGGESGSANGDESGSANGGNG